MIVQMKLYITPVQIEETIVHFLKKEIYDASIHLDKHTNLIDSGMDSFSLLSVLMFIEKKFNVLIPQEEINETRMKNVQNIADLIYDLKKK
jgi:acyl carrier protein